MLKSRSLRVATFAATALALAACQTGGPKQTGGTVLGAGAGGAAGYFLGDAIGGPGTAAALTGVGVLLGGFAGSQVGASLDRADQAYAAQTTSQALETAPSGSRSTWRNPDSGNYGYVEVDRAYSTAGYRDCRDYTHTIYVDGRAETVRGTACRQPDGTWRMLG